MKRKFIVRYFWLGLISLVILAIGLTSTTDIPLELFSSFTLRRIKEVSFESNREPGYIKIGNIGLLVGHDKAEMSRAAVEGFVAKLNEVIKKQDRVVIAMPVGDTPVDFYKILTQQYKEAVDWSKVIILQLAELVGVSGEDPASGQYLLKKDFIEPLGIKQMHFLNGKAENFEVEAQRFETLIEGLGGIDISLLGIDRLGGIAYIKPGTPFDKLTHVSELTDSKREELARQRYGGDMNKVPTHAITLGPASIMKAKEVILLASGKEKQHAIERAALGKETVHIPASRLQSHGEVNFIVDQEASSRDLISLSQDILRQDLLKVFEPYGRIELFLSDLDFTLSPIGNKIRDIVIRKWKELTDKTRTGIVTGRDYAGTKVRSIDHFPPNFNYSNFYLLNHAGSACYYPLDNQAIQNNLPPKLLFDKRFTKEQVDKIEEAIKAFEQSEFGGAFDHYDSVDINKGYKIALYFVPDKLRSAKLLAEPETLQHIITFYSSFRMELIYVFGKITAEPVSQTLIKMLGDSTQLKRRDIAIALAHKKDPHSISALQRILGDASRRFFDDFGVWIIDIGVSEDLKFKSEEIEIIRDVFRRLPREDILKGVTAIVRKNPSAKSEILQKKVEIVSRYLL
jgi:glucosamine-6-phosphate deaminase